MQIKWQKIEDRISGEQENRKSGEFRIEDFRTFDSAPPFAKATEGRQGSG